jgi:hypothetical protein
LIFFLEATTKDHSFAEVFPLLYVFFNEGILHIENSYEELSVEIKVLLKNVCDSKQRRTFTTAVLSK